MNLSRYSYAALSRNNVFCLCKQASVYQPARFRHKKAKKHAKKLPSPSELALNYFDQYYKPVFKERWPSMRLALLSQQKYGALVNNLCLSHEDVLFDLMDAGADDIISLARNSSGNMSLKTNPDILTENLNLVEPDSNQSNESEESEELIRNQSKQGRVSGSASLYDFIPATRVYTEEEELLEEEKRKGFYQPSDIEVHILPESRVRIPQLLKVFAFSKGNVRMFDPSKHYGMHHLLGYYLMDAASIMPVLALDLEPGCRVLDLCAAPGGKTLGIVQTGLPGHITCVDHSYHRLKRLRQVIRSYLPKSYTDEDKISIIYADANTFCKNLDDNYLFHRVLVDVPCFTDRHVLHENDNNIFRRNRVHDRVIIQDLQRSLLLNGIKKCKPGGNVVYSTCTLAPPQNDGVIDATLEHIHKTTNMRIVVEDLSALTARFSETFFFHKCRFGHVVVPHITANFGPMYFAKLRRLN